MTPQTRGLVLGLAAMLIGFPLMGWAFFLTHMVPDGHTDFRANYTAGYMLRTSKPQYDYAAELEAQNQVVSHEAIALPFIHPAYEALIYAPLSFLPYLRAFCLWFAVNLLVLASIYYLLRPELEALSAVVFWLPIATLAAYLPFGAALVQGQDSLLLVLLLAMAFDRMRSGDHLWLAGMCLGLAVFRFHIVLPVIMCFLLWRRWNLVAGFLATALPVAVVSVVLAGFWPYVQTLRALSVQPAWALHQNISRMPNLRGLIQSAGGGDWLVVLVSLLVLAGVVLAGRERNLQQQLALGITAATLVSYHALVHDLSVLFIPCALLFARKTESALLVAGVVFFAPVLLIFAPNHFYLAVFGVLALFVYMAVPSFGSLNLPVVRAVVEE